LYIVLYILFKVLLTDVSGFKHQNQLDVTFNTDEHYVVLTVNFII